MGGIVVNRVHAAVAKDWEILAEANFRDLDAREEVGLLRAVEDICQGSKDGIIIVGVIPELRDCLCDQYVEPVQRFGLMRVDIVVGFCQDSRRREARRGTEDMRRGAFAVSFMQIRERGVDGYRAASMGEGALGGDAFRRRGVTENEEFNKGTDEYHN